MEYERLAQVSMIILGKDKPVTEPGNSEFFVSPIKAFSAQPKLSH